jgi:hypothetical protein
MTSTGNRHCTSDYRVELVRVSKFVIRVSGLMDGLTRYIYLLDCLSRFGNLVDVVG